MFSIHHDVEAREELTLDLDEIARAGARRMLAHAVEAEADAYIEAAKDQRDVNGHALVVRNGHAKEREILCRAGALELKAPRINDRRVDEHGERRRFKSVIVPPYMRRSPKVTEVLPLLYLHGLSSGDFIPALEGFFGTEAGLSAATISRLAEEWQEERKRFMDRSLSEREYVYVWVDGVHTGVRLGSDDRLCCLVMVGARLDGTKELVAIHDGYRESTESWAFLLRDLKKRGMRAPVLAVGDGALGFWAAARDVFPETTHQRDWVHKTKNVLDSLPKSVHRRAKSAIHEITQAENKTERGEVAQGRLKDRRREGATPRLLRVPRRALAPPAHHQPHREHVRCGEGEDGPDEGAGIEGGGSGDDLQAARGGRREVETAQRLSSGGAGECRSKLRERRAGRGG
jgi:putative transposase